MILCPISIETCFAFEFQDNKLKRSPGPSRFPLSRLGLKTSTGGYSCSRVSRQEAKKVPRTFLLPKVIEYSDGQVAFVLAFVPPVFDSRLGFWADCFAF